MSLFLFCFSLPINIFFYFRLIPSFKTVADYKGLIWTLDAHFLLVCDGSKHVEKKAPRTKMQNDLLARKFGKTRLKRHFSILSSVMGNKNEQKVLICIIMLQKTHF